MVLTRGVEVEGRQQSVVGCLDCVEEADVKTLSPMLLDCRPDTVQTVGVEDIRLVVPMAAHVHLAFAVLAAAAVSEIGGVRHAMTWYERDPARTAESANSLYESVLRVVRLQRYQNTLHPVAWTRRVREAGNSGYVDPPNPPFFTNSQRSKTSIGWFNRICEVYVCRGANKAKGVSGSIVESVQGVAMVCSRS